MSFKSQSEKVMEEPVFFYTITLRSPAFCTWKEKEGAEATSDGGKLPVTALCLGALEISTP